MKTRLEEIKNLPLIEKELTRLINAIASNRNNINEDDHLRIAIDILNVRTKFE